MSVRSNDVLKKMGKDFVFPKTFGHNVEFDYTNVRGVKRRLRSVVLIDKDKPRDCKLDVYSWLFSLGAVHHYARLKLGTPWCHEENNEDAGVWVASFDRDLPFEISTQEIEVMRRVDKRDLKHDKDVAETRGDSLYGRMRPGDWTHGFWTEEEARAAAIKFFKAHFGPGWRLVANSWEGNAMPVYAKT
jgi:hypothetical protein